MSTDFKYALARNLAFAAIWTGLFGAAMIQRGDPRAVLKVGLFAASLLPAILIQLGLQRLTRYRLIVPLEAILLPFIAIAVIYTAAKTVALFR